MWKLLVAGDTYGRIFGIHLSHVMDPRRSHITDEIIPINSIIVRKHVEVSSLLATEYFLLVGVASEICAYDWNSVKYKQDASIAWRVKVIGKKKQFLRPEVHCMVGNESGLLHVGCTDNNVYEFDIQLGIIVRTFSGHTGYVNCLFNYGKLLSSGADDGVVNVWDLRDGKNVIKIKPYTNEDLARAKIGEWIGAVGLNGDSLICGGGPKMSLWPLRALKPSTIYPIEDKGIHIAEFYGETVVGGGYSDYVYTMSHNGEIISKLPTSSFTSYSLVHHEKPFKIVCISGSSSKIDVCQDFDSSGYKIYLTYLRDDPLD